MNKQDELGTELELVSLYYVENGKRSSLAFYAAQKDQLKRITRTKKEWALLMQEMWREAMELKPAWVHFLFRELVETARREKDEEV